MKHLNGHVLIGSPHSEARRNTATHICADCLESDKTPDRYHAFAIAGKPVSVDSVCDVCEQKARVAIVKAVTDIRNTYISLTCYRCGKPIATHYIAKHDEFPRVYHPTCYELEEHEALIKLGLPV